MVVKYVSFFPAAKYNFSFVVSANPRERSINGASTRRFSPFYDFDSRSRFASFSFCARDTRQTRGTQLPVVNNR